MSQTNTASRSITLDRIKQMLKWDVAPLFNWLPTWLRMHSSGLIPTGFLWPKWRVATWWPSDDAFAKQRSLLRLLAVAHRERLDLTALIGNFADEHRGFWKLRLWRLAMRIKAGTPMVDAIEQTPDVLRDEDVLALRFATQAGILPNIYQDLLRNSLTDRRLATSAIRRVIRYTLAMLLAIGLIGSFLWMFIIPTIKTMAQEFNIEAPWSIRLQAEISEWLISFWWLWFMIAIAMLVVAVNRSARRQLRHAFSGWSMRLGLSSRPAELLRLLSLATEAGRPISGSLSTLARYHFDKVIRQKLLFIRNEVEQGADAWHCLRDASLISPNEAEAIRFCPDGKTQAWTLRQLAEAKSSANSIRYQKIAAWTQPIVVLVLGLIVFWISVGHFQFLSQLLSAIQGWKS